MTSPLLKKKHNKNPTWQLNTADDGWRAAVAGMRMGVVQSSAGGCFCFPLVQTPEPFLGSSVVKASGNTYQAANLDLRSVIQAAAQTSMAVEEKVRNVLSHRTRSEKGRGPSRKIAPRVLVMECPQVM